MTNGMIVRSEENDLPKYVAARSRISMSWWRMAFLIFSSDNLTAACPSLSLLLCSTPAEVLVSNNSFLTAYAEDRSSLLPDHFSLRRTLHRPIPSILRGLDGRDCSPLQRILDRPTD